MENAFEPLRWGVGLIHMRSGAMLNVQCSGETDAPVDQVSEVWKLEGDADRSVRSFSTGLMMTAPTAPGELCACDDDGGKNDETNQ